MNVKITAKDRPKILQRYRLGRTAREIIAELRIKVSDTAIYQFLRRNGESRHSVGGRRGHNRKYRLDERFFQKIDAEEKAYWLGFIAADGHVGRTYVVFILQARDRAHLEKFRTSLQTDTKITMHQSAARKIDGRRLPPTTDCRIYVTSRNMVDDLASLGLAGRKAKRLRPPTIPANMERHFWRGVIDGDGSISRCGGLWHLSLVGTRAMVSAFDRFLQRTIHRLPTKFRNYDGAWRIGYGGKRVIQKIVGLLYGGCTVALSRKEALVKEVLQLDSRIIWRNKHGWGYVN